MKPSQIDMSDYSLPLSRFDIIIEALLLGLLAFMPLALGVVAAWSEMVVVLATGLMVLCLVIKHIIHRQVQLVWTWAYLPLALFLALVAVQLLDIPVGVLKIFSAQTVALKTELLADLPGATGPPAYLKLSFYPLATEHDLRLLLSAAAIFWVVVNVYRRDEQIKRLLLGITIIGGALALLALAQFLFGNGKIYWVIPTYDNACSGTFINHSHFGQFMNLSIGAALALLLVKLHESFQQGQVTASAFFSFLGEPALRQVWLCSGMIILAGAAVFLSLTRGGMVAMLIAGGFTAVILALKRGMEGRSWVITVMALGAFICVLYLGFDAVYERLATLQELENQDSRWDVLQAISTAWMQFKFFGAGLGTHDMVYPMFDFSTHPIMRGHADVEYAQMAEETGALGLILLAGFGAIIWHAYFRSVRNVHRPIRSVAFGLGFGLLAVMIHSVSDYGQRLPANACLAIVCAGLLIAVTRRAGHSSGSAPGRSTGSGGVQVGLKVLGLLVFIAVWSWSLQTADRARRGEAYWNEVLPLENSLAAGNWLADNPQYAEIIALADNAAACQPHNVRYRYWLNVYRWQAISRVVDPQTGNLVVTDQTLQYTRQIIDDLGKAREYCPTYGAPYSLIGQLRYFILQDPAGAADIRRAYELAPCDATCCLVAGQLDVQEGNIEAAHEKFTRTLQLDGSFLDDVLAIYLYDLNRPDLALELTRDDVGWLSKLARSLSEITEHQDLAETARGQVAILLKEKCAQPDVAPGTLAALAGVYLRDKEFEAAVEYFQRALALDYGNTNWRLTLARTLAQQGKNEEAIHQARICLRLRPQMTAATRFIEQLSVR